MRNSWGDGLRPHEGSFHLGFRGLGFRGLGFRGLGIIVWGSGFRVQGFLHNTHGAPIES